jgi:hypothetical protein
MLAAMKRTEEELGPNNIGPWSDFEWGTLNGKLSAIRWVLGDEWDTLDTRPRGSEVGNAPRDI